MDRPQDFPRAAAIALPSTVRFLKPVSVALVGITLLVAAWYATQVVVLDHLASAAVSASVAHASAPLRPDDPLQVSVRGTGVQLQSAQLFRADVAADGTRTAEQTVPVRLEPTDDEATWQLVPGNAGAPLLATDGAYRLAVRIAAPRPALPMPATDFVEQQYQFTTVASPRATIPEAVLQPRWAEPVSVTWSMPMSSVSATVQPETHVQAWIDSRDPTRTWVQLGDADGAGLADGQTYTVTVADARSGDGLAVQQPVSFKVAVPERPRFIDPPAAPVTLRYGDLSTLDSSIDLATAEVTVAGDVPAQVKV